MEKDNLILGVAGAIGQEVVNVVGKNTFVGKSLQNAIGTSAPAQAGAMVVTVLHPIVLMHPLATMAVVGVGLLAAAIHFGKPLSYDDFESDDEWMAYYIAHQL